jgi:hypothetical protein
MVFNATINNVSAISLWGGGSFISEGTGVLGVSNRSAQVPDKLHHIILYRVHPAKKGSKRMSVMSALY